MNVFAWILIGWLAFGALGTIALIGKPGHTITPVAAIASVIVTGLLIALVVLAVTA